MRLLFSILLFSIIISISCSKGGGTTQPPAPTNPCAGVTVGISGSVVNPSGTGATDGSISVTATGGSGFTFNINGGAFQSSGTFNSLAAGSYTISAKNSSGCTGSASFTLTSTSSLCTGVTITVTASSTTNVPCEANTATVNVSATGGTLPFTFSLGSSGFQSASTFSNVATGNYFVTVKDANGCVGNAVLAVTDAAAGPQFSAVKTLVQNNCVTCHNNVNANGGMNLSTDCNIVQFKDRIKARAVDGNPSPMPEGGFLPIAERQKITDWINGGGKVTN